VPLQLITALAMAMLLNQALRGMRVFRLIFYIPVILAGGAAILLTWRYMLASNGGLINETLQAAARSFFAADWLYRGFIFGVEGFNGFYSGLTRGDQVGPLIYTVPALIGAVMMLMLARGDWEQGKRDRAWLVAEVIGMVLIAMLFVRALITVPLDWGMVLFTGSMAIVGILLNVRRGKPKHARIWQIFTMIGVVGVLLVVFLGDPTLTMDQRIPYLIGSLIIGLPVAYTFIGPWNKTKDYALIGGLAAAVMVLFLRDFGSEFGMRSILPLVKYTFLGSAIEQPDDLTYLLETFPQSLASALWVWGTVALLLGGLAVANNRWPRAQRSVAIIGGIIFALIAVGSFIDAGRYFNAIEAASQAAGTPTYHFSLFRGAVSSWPGNDRVPLWLSSELWSKPSLILITMWSSGAMMLIFLAALKGVSQALYEAAKVDGANRTQRFFKITLPMISPALFYNLVIAIIAALQTFDTIYILQTTQTVDSLQSAVFFLYQRTFRQLAIGQGSATSWILAGVILLITVIQFRYSKWVHYEV
ncbi:MAG TPA: ABC transporter permease subunit, partial [Candidatus Limnocylindrales bacterium]|nr:ABC transporter permease subunit [Candidatus Limnocylindrales bacterium]